MVFRWYHWLILVGMAAALDWFDYGGWPFSGWETTEPGQATNERDAWKGGDQ